MRHDVTFLLYIEVDQMYDLVCPASRSSEVNKLRSFVTHKSWPRGNLSGCRSLLAGIIILLSRSPPSVRPVTGTPHWVSIFARAAARSIGLTSASGRIAESVA
jgi:hypothetical protein